jgi:nicotinamide mononucleotide (NMN) deamidase PncC
LRTLRVWSLADFAAAGVLLAAIGVVLELAVGKAGNLAAALGIAAAGVAAAMFGEADDAPGLVLLGILLFVSACALGVRTPSAAGSTHSRRALRQPLTLR